MAKGKKVDMAAKDSMVDMGGTVAKDNMVGMVDKKVDANVSYEA
ncbi:hypothetical protein [Bacillus sp. FJAT-45350]|nr:hypothetical protein [Bacillus sp. FJAT-45350]